MEGCGGRSTGLWCGMLCASLELVAIEKKKKPVHLLCHPLVFERLCQLRCMSAVFWF